MLEQRLLLIQLGGVLIVLFGLQMLGVLRLGCLARTYLHVDPERFAARGALAGTVLKDVEDPEIPVSLAGLAAERALHWSRGVRKHLGLIERVGGVVLVAMGILLLTGQLTLINIWVIRTSRFFHLMCHEWAFRSFFLLGPQATFHTIN
jgi:hypothetical protein